MNTLFRFSIPYPIETSDRKLEKLLSRKSRESVLEPRSFTVKTKLDKFSVKGKCTCTAKCSVHVIAYTCIYEHSTQMYKYRKIEGRA